MSSSNLAHIDQQLTKLSPDSLRYKALQALRAFRASWIDLGRLLHEVVYGGDYKEWGYDDFEAYCLKELGLKKPTIQKLMISYNYLRKYETQRLHDFEDNKGNSLVSNIPDYQTIELLDRVRKRESIDSDDISDLHSQVFSHDTDEKELRKAIRERLRPIQSSSDEISELAKQRQRDLQQLFRLSRDLRQKISAASFVPQGLKSRLESDLLELESLD